MGLSYCKPLSEKKFVSNQLRRSRSFTTEALANLMNPNLSTDSETTSKDLKASTSDGQNSQCKTTSMQPESTLARLDSLHSNIQRERCYVAPHLVRNPHREGIRMPKERQKIPRFELICGTAVLPHPEKMAKGGEDANFSHKYGLGVFDGVSTVASDGADPQDYPVDLAAQTLHFFEAHDGLCEIRTALQHAVKVNPFDGRCTACVAAVSADGNLRGVTVGDSEVRIIRDNDILYRSGTQEHHFNCPFQLGTGKQADVVDSGREINFLLQAGDTIVMASDGLWDNVYEHEMMGFYEALKLKQYHKRLVEVFGNHRGDGKIRERKANDLAWKLAYLAHQRSRRWGHKTPFNEAAWKVGVYHGGGKKDDITVVVGLVVDVSGDRTW